VFQLKASTCFDDLVRSADRLPGLEVDSDMSLFPVLIGVVGSIVFAVLLYRLYTRSEQTAQSVAGFDEEWFENFSAFRYLPMRRLLSGTDEAFLQRQNLGSKDSIRKYRAERRQLFRLYLQDLQADFNRLSLGAKHAVLNASEDQSHHVETLLKLEWQFRKSIWRAEANLFLHACGWQPSDVSGLIDVLQHFEFSLRETYLAQQEQNS
jgi:hypothetical protein